MVIAYWIVAGLLAVLYLYSGGMKLVRSAEQLRPMMAWVDTMPLSAVRVVGALEILGVVGLILPPIVGVLAWLTVAAAVGLVLVQVGGITVHLRRGEVRVLGLNVVLLVLAAIEVWLASVWL
ncbi:hypothetical protein ASF83_02340 [Plantibacter sp. Leaf171]|uniref:DoxX family protein n=1 Tax=unclassified Plantibacter TaxID=2624265 RepID=UPI0006F581AF|nr:MULTISPECIES: DoxX family protein [unclassified Plantibacter]KQM14890.1 hypothetical protein ASE44_02355 [Plantibacter sp. Leaf1]KQR58033.1 hypothetical protein ASF83_02340 [Plantibacter sp. Leaf171]